MESKPLTIYYNDADGNKQIRCKVPKWEFSDKAMSVGEQYVSFSIDSEKPIQFAVGDYCIYRGSYFYLNVLPTTEQKAEVGGTGDALKYDSVRFDSDSEKLGRVLILDITPTTGDYVAAKGTNYTGSASFQLACHETTVTVNGVTRTLTPVCYLANIIKANLDRAYPKDGWQVHVNLTSTTTKYGKTILATHTDDKVLSFNGTTAASALAEVNNTFKLDYFVKGRDIYIGYTLSSITAKDTSVKEDTSSDEFFYFGYGKGYADKDHQGKALFDIKRNANPNQQIITRLRAMGSTRNMPYRYYNKKYNLPQSLFPTNLQLPDTFETPSVKATNNTSRKKTYPFLRDVKGDTNDAYIDKNDDAEKCVEGMREGRAMWDGSDANLEEIYPTIKEGTYRDLRAAEQKDSDGYTEKSTTKTDGNGRHSFLNYEDNERVDEIASVDTDANIGDGIDEDPAASARGWIDIPQNQSGEYIVNNSSVGARELKTRGSNGIVWEGDLGTVDNQYAGDYTLSPNFANGFVIGAKLNSPTKFLTSVKVWYCLYVYAKGSNESVESEIYSYTDTPVTLNVDADNYSEIPILAIPQKDGKITLKQTSSVRVRLVVYTSYQGTTENTYAASSTSIAYYIGKIKNSAYTATDFTAQMRWSPVDASTEYLNKPFHIIIKDMGFDLKAQFNGKDEPCVEMQDGYCAGYKFKISDNVEKVTYTKNGKSYIGYKLSLTRASDSSTHTYFPSIRNKLLEGDHYILTGIQMPDVYVKMAEMRLLIAATQYLADNSETKYTYEPSIDNIYLARNYDRCKKDGDVTKSVYWNLYAGMKFPFRGLPETGAKDETLPFINITIESLTIKEEDGYTPKVEMTLNDDIDQSTYQKITTAVNRIYDGSLMNEFLNGVSGGASKSDMIALIQEQGKQLFLSKTSSDTAKGNKYTFEHNVETIENLTVHGNITTEGALTTDELHSSSYSDSADQGVGKGYRIWVNGTTSNMQIDNLTVRGKWTASILDVMKLQYSAGNITIDGAGGEIFAVEPYDANGNKTVDSTTSVAFYRCYFKATDGDKHIQNEWHVGDQAKCQTFNLTDGTYTNAANRGYFRVVKNVSKKVVKVNDVDCWYIDLSNLQNDTLVADVAVGNTKVGDTVPFIGIMHDRNEKNEIVAVTNDAPMKGDQIAHVGNVYDTARQGAVQLVAVGEDNGLFIYGGINETLSNISQFLQIRLSPDNTNINTRFITFTNGYHENHPYIQCGDWVSGTTAHASEVWQHNGSSWICDKETTTEPSENNAAWSIMAKQGKQGIQGIQGVPGKDGTTPSVSISSDGYWVINGKTTTDKAIGDDGHNPYVGSDGLWYTWDNAQGKFTSTGIKAKGDKGDPATSYYVNPEAVVITERVNGTAEFDDNGKYTAKDFTYDTSHVIAIHKSVGNVDTVVKADTISITEGAKLGLDTNKLQSSFVSGTGYQLSSALTNSGLKSDTTINKIVLQFGWDGSATKLLCPIYINRLGTVTTETVGDSTVTVREKVVAEVNPSIKAAQDTADKAATAASKAQSTATTANNTANANKSTLTTYTAKTEENANELSIQRTRLERFGDNYRNLLVGSGLSDLSKLGGEISKVTNPDNICEVSDDVRFGGQRALHVKVTAANSYIGIYFTPVAIKRNTKYHVSFWIKGSGQASIEIVKKTKASRRGSDRDGKFKGLSEHDITSEWSRLDCDFITDGTHDFIECNFWVNAINTDCYMSNFILEEGDACTGWTPNVNDTAAEYRLQSEIRQTADNINLSVKKVNDGLSATGIDITNHKITSTADSFEWKDNNGNYIAKFDKDNGASFSGNVTATSFSTANGTFSASKNGYVVCTAGKLGNWTIKDGGFYADYNSGAYIELVENGGESFFRVQANKLLSSEALLSIRNDYGIGVEISTYNHHGLRITSNGTDADHNAIMSFGNVAMAAREVEGIFINRPCFGLYNASGDATFDHGWQQPNYGTTYPYEDSFPVSVITCSKAGATIKLPYYQKLGMALLLINISSGDINIDGNGKSIRDFYGYWKLDVQSWKPKWHTQDRTASNISCSSGEWLWLIYTGSTWLSKPLSGDLIDAYDLLQFLGSRFND